MRVAHNPKSTYYRGHYTIYASLEEAQQNGISPYLDGDLHRDTFPDVGEWVQFQPTGEVMQVLKVGYLTGKSVKTKYVYPMLTLPEMKMITISGKKVSYTDMSKRGREKRLPTTLTNGRLMFLEDWLLKGKRMEQAVIDNIRNEYYRWRKTSSLVNIERSAVNIRMYGYFILSQGWFDEVLQTNKVMRDRYMSLVGALNSEGVTDVWFAKKLKEMAGSENYKERIAAVNKIGELLAADEAKNKGRRPVDAPFAIVEEMEMHNRQLGQTEAKQIEQHTTSDGASHVGTEAKHFTNQVPSDKVEGERSGGTDSSERYASVRIGNENRNTASLEHQVVSQESKMTEAQINSVLADVIGEDYVEERLKRAAEAKVREEAVYPQTSRANEVQVCTAQEV